MTVNKRSIATGGKRLDPARKLLKGDELTFTAQPHDLALVTQVAALKSGGVTLLIAPRPRTEAADHLAKQRALSTACPPLIASRLGRPSRRLCW